MICDHLWCQSSCHCGIVSNHLGGSLPWVIVGMMSDQWQSSSGRCGVMCLIIWVAVFLRILWDDVSSSGGNLPQAVV